MFRLHSGWLGGLALGANHPAQCITEKSVNLLYHLLYFSWGFLVLRPRLSRPTVSLRQPLQSAVLTASLSAVCVATEYHNEQIRNMNQRLHHAFIQRR